MCDISSKRSVIPQSRRIGKGKLFRRNRIDVDATPAAIESDAAVDQRKDRVVAAETEVFARHKFRAALTDDDVTGHNRFAAKSFDPKAFANAVTTVLNAALS